jgi:hypothetical protein
MHLKPWGWLISGAMQRLWSNPERTCSSWNCLLEKKGEKEGHAVKKGPIHRKKCGE